MKSILILTKNLVLEQALQERLQHLSYEVFCSVQLFECLRTCEYQEEAQIEWLEEYLTNYKVIILSETLSDSEIKGILPTLQARNGVLLRKLSSAPTKEEEEQLKGLGIDDWLVGDSSLDFLREQMSEKLKSFHKEDANIVFLYPEYTNDGNLKKLRTSLSNRELSALDCLMQAKGEVVSREELCACLWNEAPNNSHLSQASVLIKRIKVKLGEAGYDPELLKTIWGKGYLLSKNTLRNQNLRHMR